VQFNQALGGSGGDIPFTSPGFAGPGGEGSGGGISVAGGTVTLDAVDLLSNLAQGGQGGSDAGSGGQGGNGFGGALYVGAGTVTLSNDTVTNNIASGGGKGDGNFPTAGGGGFGQGDGIDILSTATVYLDTFTLANTADSIEGTYILQP
jgi:hypothetical protein